MSITYGFYDSFNGDRKYYASQLSSIFDGIIVDGIFASIGTAFAVKASTGNVVKIGIGKAWFNHTWTYNDSDLLLAAPEADDLYDRIDAVVIEIDSRDSIRANDIKFVKGEASSNPQRPILTNDELVHQYPLCYVRRVKRSSEITQADITNMIGTESTPFITGILQTISLDELLGQWQAQLDQFVKNETEEIDEWLETMKRDLTTEQEFLDRWIANEQADFLAWYNSMKDQLGEDAAGNLQIQIDKEEIERILVSGFVDGSKNISADGKVITSTASDGRILTKVFSDDFKTMTTVLMSATGGEVAQLVKTFDDTGSLINTTVNYS